MSIKKQIELPSNKKPIDLIPPHDGKVDDVPVLSKKSLIGFNKEKLVNLIRSEIKRILKERGINRMDEYVGATEEITGLNGEIEIGSAHGRTKLAIALRETGEVNPLKYIIFNREQTSKIIELLEKHMSELN